MPDLTISLPTLAERQIEAHTRFLDVKKALLVRHRRWGATTLAQTIAVDAVVKGKQVGWFDGLSTVGSFEEIAGMLEPVATSTSKDRGVIRTHPLRGRFEFYDSASEHAGFCRVFDLVIVDNTTRSTEALHLAMYGNFDEDARVLVLLSDEDVVAEEFAHLARI